MKTVDEAHAAGARDGAAGLGAIAPKNGPPGSLANRLHAAYMQSYRDALVARVGVGSVERRRNRRGLATDELQRAARLYRAFREAPPQRARSVRVDLPKAVARIGTVEFIGYMTTHGGKVSLYVHDFAPGSRPALYAGTRRNQLYMFGGRFKVTARGITDLDARGRITDYSPRYEHAVKGRRGKT